ncbi:TetR/AcrR family transcriptional regulator [Kineococcus gypseus]|uniref:TetR/AcrR family transcriptional regulator n=1 Tax=Kineococcus gypseus TaxID=1637102 RepID=UPI003D7C746D
MTTDAAASPPRTAGPRTTRRREQTRARLLDAALELLAEQGLARSSVEGVCERAGYTRGAFYSNFQSMDEVVAALYARRAARVLEHVQAQLAGPEVPAVPGASGVPGDPAGPGPLPGLVARVLELLPVDAPWRAVRAEFSAQALRSPAAAEVLASARERLLQGLAPLLADGLARAGRRPATGAGELARAVLAAHEGATAPGASPGPAGGRGPDRAFEVRLVTAVLEAFSAPSGEPAPGERAGGAGVPR